MKLNVIALLDLWMKRFSVFFFGQLIREAANRDNFLLVNYVIRRSDHNDMFCEVLFCI
jgi:hypothetical protein